MADLLLNHRRPGRVSISPIMMIIVVTFLMITSCIASTSGDGNDGDESQTSYLISPATFFPDYNRMITTLKIYPYRLATLTPPHSEVNHISQTHALFHSSLVLFSSLNQGFLTQNPEQAHLFYLPFPPGLSHRQLSDEINSLRLSLPYWNRSLAADHFFLVPSCSGVPPSTYRNTVELRKNAVQITCFNSPSVDNFVPHKDVSLPPHNTLASKYSIPPPFVNDHIDDYYDNDDDDKELKQPRRWLGYFRYWNAADHRVVHLLLLKELEKDPDFMIDTQHQQQPSDAMIIKTMKTSQFCLFIYGGGVDEELIGLAEAMKHGCVPVLISLGDRPIHDMPLTNVLRWQELAVFVGSSVGPEGLKRLLLLVGEDHNNKYAKMRELGMAAAKHLVWNYPPKPYDAFHMVLYQLWMRRHAVRYNTWDRM